jgi:hypothetical protein
MYNMAYPICIGRISNRAAFTKIKPVWSKLVQIQIQTWQRIALDVCNMLICLFFRIVSECAVMGSKVGIRRTTYGRAPIVRLLDNNIGFYHALFSGEITQEIGISIHIVYV